MLSRCEKPRATASRIKGRQALVRSLRGLLIRVHRFGRGRARSPEDVRWAARTIDALADCLRGAEGLTAPPLYPGTLPPHDAPSPQLRGGR